MRRVVTLLNQVAVSIENNADVQAQMDSALKAAQQHQQDNLTLNQVRTSPCLSTHCDITLNRVVLSVCSPL